MLDGSAKQRDGLLHALLFLKAIFSANPRLEEEAIWLVFGFDYDSGLLGTAFDLWRVSVVSSWSCNRGQRGARVT